VVAVTNDFSWVQIRWDEGEINERAPAAEGVRVTWRSGHGLPQTLWPLPFPRLRAVEAITGITLTVTRIRGAYRVDLPPFDFLALLVVTAVPRPLPTIPRPPSRARSPGDAA
jgi:hypothetical protein